MFSTYCQTFRAFCQNVFDSYVSISFYCTLVGLSHPPSTRNVSRSELYWCGQYLAMRRQFLIFCCYWRMMTIFQFLVLFLSACFFDGWGITNIFANLFLQQLLLCPSYLVDACLSPLVKAFEFLFLATPLCFGTQHKWVGLPFLESRYSSNCISVSS